ncbi:hypothetical protein GCM10007972_04330 [Iodidimonas muriae]|uniref:DUF202 domain-containing protein n=1 Tax=Iodidimonas muriae TaxID=261467 RepID=A0ABQ2L882_9PROT|nr:DUF202 domain-containing protein [Iodidimonas muriae]GER08140.1 hypothetical protein JCM17843_24500 [Kordiimonadales bacterium JCM 17843]GGO06219.1 hypothetical protein GCM10007972_04330 [Iodidimonas muriae]
MTDEADIHTEYAETRTDLAEDRTIMANERTFGGWMRTGLAAIGIGLGFNALFGKLEPNWIPKLIATLFMLMGIVIFVTAQRQAVRVLKRLDTHESAPVSRKYMALFAGGLSVGAACLIAAIWLMDWTAG